jgi:hypothetical protein
MAASYVYHGSGEKRTRQRVTFTMVRGGNKQDSELRLPWLRVRTNNAATFTFTMDQGVNKKQNDRRYVDKD